MMVPVLLKLTGTMHEMVHRASEEHERFGHGLHLFLTNPAALADMGVVAAHALSTFAVMAVVALVVYKKLGLMILKRTWINADLMWAGALVVADPHANQLTWKGTTLAPLLDTLFLEIPSRNVPNITHL